MNSFKLIPALLLGCSISARANIIYDNNFNGAFANGAYIPPGSLTGWSDSETISGESGVISSLTVNLNITGGYNGNLYGYLSYDGVLVTLLNRVGVGSSTPTSSALGYWDSGFDITLSSTAANNLHFYQNLPGFSLNANGQLTGAWQPDGSALSPLSPPSSFDSSPGAQTLNSYAGLDPNGTWTLFIADVVSGGGQSQLDSYSLDITTTQAVSMVPEPGGPLAGILAGLFALGSLFTQRRAAK
jgi:hypothetical protein